MAFATPPVQRLQELSATCRCCIQRCLRMASLSKMFVIDIVSF
jgi:hypothetical protein